MILVVSRVGIHQQNVTMAPKPLRPRISRSMSKPQPRPRLRRRPRPEGPVRIQPACRIRRAVRRNTERGSACRAGHPDGHRAADRRLQFRIRHLHLIEVTPPSVRLRRRGHGPAGLVQGLVRRHVRAGMSATTSTPTPPKPRRTRPTPTSPTWKAAAPGAISPRRS